MFSGRQPLDQILNKIKEFGIAKLGVIFAIGILSIGCIHLMISKISEPSLSVLYSNLDLGDASKIVNKIETMGIAVDIRQGGTAIYVPSDSVARLRMELAELGLPRGGSTGYEIFDRSEGLGTSSFIQDINHLRALEGEISRSISSISAVESARVHLVLPRREIFSRDRQEPSASIVLTLNMVAKLSPSKVKAIQYMVAAAVPSLVPEKVSIVDDRGNLLAKGDNQTQITAISNLEEMRIAHENRMSQTIERLLEKHVGLNKIRAEVSVTMNFDRITENTEMYDPDGQVIRSKQTSAEDESSLESANNKGDTSIESSLPRSKATNELAGAKANNKKHDKTVNYEISKTLKTHIKEIGEIKRLSIAVMVDGKYNKDAGGNLTYDARSEDELNKIKTLVKNAIGFNQQRGDSIEVLDMQFARTGVDVPTVASTWISLSNAEIIHLVEVIVMGLLGLFGILFFVKPVIYKIFAKDEEADAMEEDMNNANQAQLMDQSTDDNDAIKQADGDTEDASTEGQFAVQFNDSMVRKIATVVESNPLESANLVREWIHERK